MEIKKIVIYIQFDNDTIHQVLDTFENKLNALEVLRIINDGKIPVKQEKESFEFEI